MAVRLAIENKGGLGHKSLGRGKILRQQDNRIHMTDSKYLNIIKAEGGGGLVPEVKLYENIYLSPSDRIESEVVSFSALLPCLYSLGSRG